MLSRCVQVVYYGRREPRLTHSVAPSHGRVRAEGARWRLWIWKTQPDTHMGQAARWTRRKKSRIFLAYQKCLSWFLAEVFDFFFEKRKKNWKKM